MSLTPYFYHGSTKRYIALFGSMFSKITLARTGADGEEIQRLIVPINYGPYQKWLAKIKQDKNLDEKAAMILPRMSFEINGVTYDGMRKVGSLKNVKLGGGNTVYSGAPYNLDFTLTIMTKYAEDGVQIVEQIIPFFKPERTLSVELIEGMDYLDIPIILTSVAMDDSYEADFETRRAIFWTLTFTLKGWYFGPTTTPARIKFMDIRTHMTKDNFTESRTTIQPGLTQDGKPTTDPTETIPYQDINEEDDWAVITVIEENIEDPNQ